MKVKDLINLYRDDLKEYLIIEIRENNNNLIEFNVNNVENKYIKPFGDLHITNFFIYSDKKIVIEIGEER